LLRYTYVAYYDAFWVNYELLVAYYVATVANFESLLFNYTVQKANIGRPLPNIRDKLKHSNQS